MYPNGKIQPAHVIYMELPTYYGMPSIIGGPAGISTFYKCCREETVLAADKPRYVTQLCTATKY